MGRPKGSGSRKQNGFDKMRENLKCNTYRDRSKMDPKPFHPLSVSQPTAIKNLDRVEMQNFIDSFVPRTGVLLDDEFVHETFMAGNNHSIRGVVGFDTMVYLMTICKVKDITVQEFKNCAFYPHMKGLKKSYFFDTLDNLTLMNLINPIDIKFTNTEKYDILTRETWDTVISLTESGKKFLSLMTSIMPGDEMRMIDDSVMRREMLITRFRSEKKKVEVKKKELFDQEIIDTANRMRKLLEIGL